MKSVVVVAVPEVLASSVRDVCSEFISRVDFRPFDVNGDSKIEAEVLVLDIAASRIASETLGRTSGLRWVHTLSSGVDNILGPEFGPESPLLTSSAGTIAKPMAEFVIGAILVEAKQIRRLIANSSNRLWDRGEIEMKESSELSVLVVGHGHLGREIARLCDLIGFRVTVCTASSFSDQFPYPVYSSDKLSEMLPFANVLVLACALTDSTRGLMNNDRFSLMRSDAVVINVSRGEVICEESLAEALRNGKLKSAWLDVFCNEPLPSTSGLWGVEGLIITPHVSSFSSLNLPRQLAHLKENLLRYLDNQPLLNQVDPRRGY